MTYQLIADAFIRKNDRAKLRSVCVVKSGEFYALGYLGISSSTVGDFYTAYVDSDNTTTSVIEIQLALGIVLREITDPHSAPLFEPPFHRPG